MAQKQLLHELLKQNQEPFHLKTFISDKRSQLKKTPSPMMSPRKSPAAVFLHVPPQTADILLQAAMRIQNQQKSKLQPQIKNVGLGVFGSFLKILKDRSKSKNIFRNSDADEREKLDGDIISCRLDKELDQINNGDSGLLGTRYCASPFRFSFCQSSSSSGRYSPEICSPAASPSRRVNQEKEYYNGENSDDVNIVDDAEKEQCSPVSVLDTFFEDDDGHESPNEEGDDDNDYDLECSYANVQKAKQQLLDRLRRFEKLAELDPLELERSFLEDSDDECERECVVSNDDREPYSYEKQSVDRFLNEAFCFSNLQQNSRKMCTDKKRLVSNLSVEKKSKISCFGDNEIVLEFDMVVELDLKRGFEVVEEIEVAIFEQLLEEFV
ncbi:hypothetical protein CASFOL_032203 [Castilleja foliolosa]|uniref:Uncharacterized protein n=1 Tax=Castilleja foliolosa TaxID=1961234 RepID=A0ABD3C3J6_9LAMI